MSSSISQHMSASVWAIKCMRIITNKPKASSTTSPNDTHSSSSSATCSSSEGLTCRNTSSSSSSSSSDSLSSAVDNLSTHVAQSLETFHHTLLSVFLPPNSSSSSYCSSSKSSTTSSSSSPSTASLLSPCFPCVSPFSSFSSSSSVGLLREAQHLLSPANPLGVLPLIPWATVLDGRYQSPSHLSLRIRSNLSFYWANYVTIIFYSVMLGGLLLRASSYREGAGVRWMFALFIVQLILSTVVPLHTSLGWLSQQRWSKDMDTSVKYGFILFLSVHVFVWVLYIQQLATFVFSFGVKGGGGPVVGILLVLVHAALKPREWNRVMSEKIGKHSD
eukprot:GHVS01067428.1.p1 GENE.GHVS01067428.1~~GHVS01067428.1.p1  ORF type:complete len:341 (+),score=70.89 GHVS01067428.1:28-1023(+)